MATVGIRSSAPQLLKAHAACMGIDDWLRQEGLPSDELEGLLSKWTAAPVERVLSRPDSADLIQGPYLLPPEIETQFLEDKGFQIDPEMVTLLLKWYIEMQTTPYEVVVQNSTQASDLEQLTVTFYLNILIGNVIQPTGPFTKSLAVLPAGKTVGFQTTPRCLEMADNYFIQFLLDGQKYTFHQRIPDLNNQERQQFGTADFCGDSLEIFEE